MVETVRTTVADEASVEKLSVRLLEAVARARGTVTDDLELCLYEHVDVAALGELFGCSPSAPTRRGSVSFSIEELLVTVAVGFGGDARISVEPMHAAAAAAAGRSHS